MPFNEVNEMRYRDTIIQTNGVLIATTQPQPCVVCVRWMWDETSFVYVLTPKDGDWLAAVKQLIDDDYANTYGDSEWFNEDMNRMVYDVSLPTIINPERMCVHDREN